MEIGFPVRPYYIDTVKYEFDDLFFAYLIMISKW
jgi:hypothetical protein